MEVQLTHEYSRSLTLIVGINKYSAASPLQYAVCDARAIFDLLIDRFGFEQDDMTLLLDEEASRDNILREYLAFTKPEIDSDSRLIVFFAGHGHTLTSRRGEVGFLVPYDGDPTDLSSLIRWDQLTRSADLIPSKHILFLMDACYGGLAITRAMQPGATRFIKDMLVRYSRQVLTAGKADELVADLGGPLPDHSVFTGYLIEALNGGAADTEGILTANGVMAYVYRNVSQDPDSNQTPHFGYLDGDGDMIFDAPILDELKEDEQEGKDFLFTVPVPPLSNESMKDMRVEDKTKELLSDAKYRIHLHDLVTEKTRETMALTDDEKFPVDGSWNEEEFANRLKDYERATNDLVTIASLFGRWATADHSDTLTLPARRLAGRIQPSSGLNVWLSLRWYPVFLLTYSLGISAVSSSNYMNLAEFFHVLITDQRRGTDHPLILAVVSGIGDLNAAFKSLPGHERQYVPHSEYLYTRLQPKLDDLLFLGNEYETIFDRFELFLALEHSHLNQKHGRNFWGPIGRFGWKHSRGYGSPFLNLVQEANVDKGDWPPVKAGLFDGSFDRFEEVSTAYADLLGRLAWY